MQIADKYMNHLNKKYEKKLKYEKKIKTFVEKNIFKNFTQKGRRDTSR